MTCVIHVAAWKRKNRKTSKNGPFWPVFTDYALTGMVDTAAHGLYTTIKEDRMENTSIPSVLIPAIIIIAIVLIFMLIRKRQRSSSIIVLDRIREINEYASHELNYFENICHEEVMRIFNLAIPFIKKGFSISIIGKIKIGINMNNVHVSIHNRNVYISIPEITILSHETKTSEIAFQTKNPFFQNDLYDFNQKLEEKKSIKERAILQDSALIEKVYEDLKKKITASLLSVPNFARKFKVHYRIETPALLIEEKARGNTN